MSAQRRSLLFQHLYLSYVLFHVFTLSPKDGTAAAQQFVDGVSRLLYAAADVDGDMSGNELNFITRQKGWPPTRSQQHEPQENDGV